MAKAMSMDARAAIQHYLATGCWPVALEVARQERAWRKRRGFDTALLDRFIARLAKAEEPLS